MTLDEYANANDFSVFRTEDDSYYNGNYEQFVKYLYNHSIFVKHIDEYDEDLYSDQIICIYKYYYPSENYFYYTISIYKGAAGLESGNLEFKQKLPYNEELTVEYIKSLRKLLNI